MVTSAMHDLVNVSIGKPIHFKQNFKKIAAEYTKAAQAAMGQDPGLAADIHFLEEQVLGMAQMADMSASNLPAPFGWPGGKSRLKKQILAAIPAHRVYVEPFAGGAALFFALQPKRALLCDINPCLMLTYRAVRDQCSDVIRQLRGLARRHSEASYYRARDRFNNSEQEPVKRAALFIYLNKTCFNGLYRVNRFDEFNVPVGRYKKPNIVNAEGLRAASEQLQHTHLLLGGYRKLLSRARPGDFVYLDPPYASANGAPTFTAYSRTGFALEHHVGLRNVFVELDSRDCKLMLSNSDVPSIHDLYSGYNIKRVWAPRSINANAKRRGSVPEVVIRNY